MPITEVVRVLTVGHGTKPDGTTFHVELTYDTDGRHGSDGDAIGFPAFWLRVGGEVLGPYEHEDEAVDAAEALGVERWG